MKQIANYIFYFFSMWYVCGFILVGLVILSSWLEWSNSVFIITAGVLSVLYFMIRYSNRFGLIISALIFLATFVIEYFGSAYEILFGSYTYTNQFAPNVFGVPIAIGFAWVMVIATGHAILSKLAIQEPLVRTIIGGLLALVMDLILDPVASCSSSCSASFLIGRAKRRFIMRCSCRFLQLRCLRFYGIPCTHIIRKKHIAGRGVNTLEKHCNYWWWVRYK